MNIRKQFTDYKDKDKLLDHISDSLTNGQFTDYEVKLLNHISDSLIDRGDIDRLNHIDDISLHDSLTDIDIYNNQVSKIIANHNKVIFNSKTDLLEFSRNWSQYISQKAKNWPLWADYFQFTQENPKNELKNLYNHLLPVCAEKKDVTFDYSNIYTHVKRGCKIGIDIALKNPDVEIHFLLDDIEFEDIVLKDEEYSDRFTSIELRYLYRNRNKLNGKVIFVKEGKVVAAPWIQNPESWKNYQPKSEQQIIQTDSSNKKQSKRLNDTTKGTSLLNHSKKPKRIMLDVLLRN